MQCHVTVSAVKEQELPDLDDDFAQMASEFDTVEELRADLRERVARVKRMEQALEARDKTLDALLSMVDVPLPERFVGAQVERALRRRPTTATTTTAARSRPTCAAASRRSSCSTRSSSASSWRRRRRS